MMMMMMIMIIIIIIDGFVLFSLLRHKAFSPII